MTAPTLHLGVTEKGTELVGISPNRDTCLVAATHHLEEQFVDLSNGDFGEGQVFGGEVEEELLGEPAATTDRRRGKVSLAKHVIGIGGECRGVRRRGSRRLFEPAQKAEPLGGVGTEVTLCVAPSLPSGRLWPPFGPPDGHSV